MKNILITTAIIAGVAMSASAVQAQTDGFNLGFRASTGTSGGYGGLTLGYDFGSFYAGVQFSKWDKSPGKKTNMGVEALYNIDGPLSMGLGYYNTYGLKRYAVLARLTADLGKSASVYAQTEVYTKTKDPNPVDQNKSMFDDGSVGVTWNLG